MLRHCLPVYIAVFAMITRWRNIESFPTQEVNKRVADLTNGLEMNEDSYNVHRSMELSPLTSTPAPHNEQFFAANNAIRSVRLRPRHTVQHGRHRPANAFSLPTSNTRHLSDLIVFADRHPSLPPLSFTSSSGSDVTAPVADDDLIPTNTSGRERKPEASETADGEHPIFSRRRRSVAAARSGFPHPHQNRQHHHQQQPSLIPVCASVSEWVQRTDAEDFLGNRVRLVQDIDNGSSRVGQYFFETYCSGGGGTSGHRHHHHGSCNGIDSSQFESVCYETHSFVYGLVSDYSRSGEGWTFVKIRTGCNCGLLARRSADGGRQSSSWQSRRSSQ